MRYLNNYQDFILEKRNHTEKIKKFANVPTIINWANNLDSDMALWLANTLTIELKKESKKRGYSDEELTKYLSGEANIKIDIIANILIKTLSEKFTKILDYINSPLQDTKPNINKLSLEEALQKSDEWHTEIEKFAGNQIEDEEGEIIMTFPNGYYWIDLQTTKCEAEAKAMGHCGNTNQGTTLLSLRKNKYPFVTIAYDEEEDKFTQIKGRGNKKPIEKYHQYVVDLIIFLEVDKFKSEYDRSTDLTPDDLSQELYNKLELENPDYIENSKPPTIEEMRESYKEDILNDINEYISIYPNYFVRHIDDDEFVKELISNESENTNIEDLIDMTNKDTIIDLIKDIIPEDELNEYIINHINNNTKLDNNTKTEKLNDLDDDFEYLNDLDDKELEKLIDDLNYNDDIVDKYFTDKYEDTTAEEYLEELYGKNYSQELSGSLLNWLKNYFDEDAFAQDIAEDEDKSYLEERYA